MTTMFRILGPVEVQVSGIALNLGPLKQRTVLASLLADAGQPVSLDTLIERVWDNGSAPHHARNVLYAHVARIRRLLTQHIGPMVQLHGRGGGYRLEVDPDLIDLHRFRRLVEQAGTTAPRDRIHLLRSAIALWRGRPLADLSGGWVSRFRDGWTQRHLAAIESWSDAELIDGDPTVAAGRLAELVVEHPFAEGVVSALMRALHATGRSAEAVEVYAVTRRLLADQLGLDPSAGLRQVHQAILRHDLPPIARPLPADATAGSRG